jgi:hypothetical protein
MPLNRAIKNSFVIIFQPYHKAPRKGAFFCEQNMAAELITLPFRPVINTRGVLEPGALLDVFQAGTTTRISVFSDSDLSAALSNPVVANSSGVFPSVYWDNVQAVRVRVRESDGTVLGDADPYFSDGLSSTDISFIQSGTGATTRTVQAKLRDTVSPMDFGAVGNGTTDDRTALLNALQSGKPVDGFGLTYAISDELLPSSFKGLSNCNLKWSSTGAMATQKALLFIRDLSDWFIENCEFDMGTVENTGSADDSSRNGLRITTTSPNVTFNERVRIQNNRFKGFGNGTRLSVRSCRNVIVTGNIVTGSQVTFSPDPTNDCQNGIDITQCINAVVSDNTVRSMQTRLSGNLQKRYSRGILVAETRDSTISNNVVSFVDQGIDFSGAWDAVTNTNGNVGLSITGNEVSDVYTWGIKLANVARDCTVTGNTVRRFGLGGFVFSGSSVAIADATKNTQRVRVTGNIAADATGEFSSNCRGFWITQQAASTGYPRGVVLSGNTVSNTGGGAHLLRGFENEVAYDGSSLFLNELLPCNRATGFADVADVGFVAWRVQLTGSAAQSIPNSTVTAVTWEAEAMDGWAGHAANSADITIAVSARYRVSYGLRWASNGTGFRTSRVNADGALMNGTERAVTAISGTVTAMGATTEVNLNAGQVLRIVVEQTSGGALNLEKTDSVFIVERIGEV